MYILSCFDGISCGQIALEKSNIKIENYFASEVKKYAIDLVRRRYPKTIQLGNIESVNYINGVFEVQRESGSWLTVPGIYQIDLVIGGSPCKGGSRVNRKRDGLLHPESILFYEYIRLLRQCQKSNKNVYFLLENVAGNVDFISTITKELGVKPLKLNSKLVSAQTRDRLYWTNIPVNSLPPKKTFTTKDVFTNEMPEDLIISDTRALWLKSESGQRSVKKGYTKINPYPRAGCIMASGHKKWNETYIEKDGIIRHLSINELEKLQTIPIDYCKGLSYAEAYDVIGDGWTVDIISHIFNHLPNKFKKP